MSPKGNRNGMWQLSRDDCLWGAGIFVVALAVFASSPMRPVMDSNYSLLLSEQILRHGTTTLTEYFQLPLDPSRYPGILPDDHRSKALSPPGYPYQVELANAAVYYRGAPGSSLLSIPFVATFNGIGVSTISADQMYDAGAEQHMEAVIASLLMAFLTVVFFATARLLLSPAWAAVVAFGGAFGTPIWSIASRVLWLHTWGTLLLGAALYLILRSEVTGERLRAVLLATLLALAYVVRPQHVLSLCAITAYVLLYHRRETFAYLVTGAAWSCALVAYSWTTRHQLLPDYFHGARLGTGHFTEGLLGVLFSPSRGLLVLCPVVIAVAYLLLRGRTAIRAHRLVSIALVVIAAHIAMISTVSNWWGGYGYGPRLMTDIVPWGVLLACLGLDAHRNSDGGRLWWAECVGALALLALSVGMHAIGAISPAAWAWNDLPISIDYAPERIWDWHDPQFLAPWRAPDPQERDFPPYAAWQRVHIADGAGQRYLGRGWGAASNGIRPIDEPGADIRFWLDPEHRALLGVQPVLRLGLVGSGQAGESAEPPRVHVVLNDQRVAFLAVGAKVEEGYAVRLPVTALQEYNALRIQLAQIEAGQVVGLGWFDLVPDLQFPPLQRRVELALSTPAAERYLGSGWSEIRGGHRSLAARSGRIAFAVDHPEDGATLRLRYQAPDTPIRLDLLVNGQIVATRGIRGAGSEEISATLVPAILRARNLLQIDLTDESAFGVPRSRHRNGEFVIESVALD